ncbi:hypothetical protein IB385_005022 [Escherichia coli]|nr:hypothetical protein [Escherichia coli]EGF1779453.1 hypothetical protein [Escherichia coli]
MNSLALALTAAFCGANQHDHSLLVCPGFAGRRDGPVHPGMFINRNLNPKKIKKTPEKGRFLSIVTHAMTSTSSIKWTALIDTGYQ